MTRRKARTWLTRDTVLLVSGLAGIFYETVFDKVDRPALLVVFAAMCGLTQALHADERRSRPPDTPPEDEDKP